MQNNTTEKQKISLRRETLRLVDGPPIIMEAYGGIGTLYTAVYASLGGGVVFENDPYKAQHLARQRPTWAVYECNVVKALAEGVGRHRTVNLLDVDPYGDPWPVLHAFFTSDRPRSPQLVVVVNDGLRQKARIGGAWKSTTLQEPVLVYGNTKVYEEYLAVCQELMEKHAAQAGYRLSRWHGYYCGHHQQIAHYAAVLNLTGSGAAALESPG